MWEVAEKLQAGSGLLSNKELLEYLGVKGAHEQVLAVMERPSFEAFMSTPGIGKASAMKLLAALELGQRFAIPRKTRIFSPGDIAPLCADIANEEQEHFLVFSLNGAHEVIRRHIATIGLINRALVHPREIFRKAIQDNAAAIIVAHNHPSGNLEPSPEDREVTKRLHSAGETLGVALLDHMILSQRGYFSFLEHDMIGR